MNDLESTRHTLSHVLAAAVKKLYKELENFYKYDGSEQET